MAKANKFAALKDALKEKKDAPKGKTPERPRKTPPKSKSAAKKKSDTPPERLAEVDPVEHKRGKRTDGSYVQVSAYIPRALRIEVKKLLLDKDNLDFSELVHELLRDWTARQQAKSSAK